MARLAKTVTDRVSQLEFELDQLKKIISQLTAQPGGVPSEPSKVGSVGVQIPPQIADPTDISADQFLFDQGPKIIQKLTEADQETAITLTDWLLDESKVIRFFLLWFASNEEIRKYLLFTAVLRNLSINGARFQLMQNTISPEGLEEVKKAYQQIIDQAQNAAKQATAAPEAATPEAPVEQPPPAEVIEPELISG